MSLILCLVTLRLALALPVPLADSTVRNKIVDSTAGTQAWIPTLPGPVLTGVDEQVDPIAVSGAKAIVPSMSTAAGQEQEQEPRPSQPHSKRIVLHNPDTSAEIMRPAKDLTLANLRKISTTEHSVGVGDYLSHVRVTEEGDADADDGATGHGLGVRLGEVAMAGPKYRAFSKDLWEHGLPATASVVREPATVEMADKTRPTTFEAHK